MKSRYSEWTYLPVSISTALFRAVKHLPLSLGILFFSFYFSVIFFFLIVFSFPFIHLFVNIVSWS